MCGFTIKVVVIVESQPFAFGITDVYVPAVVLTVPSGVVYELPAQIATEVEELVCGFTIKVVVIVESQPFAFGITDVYVPAVVLTVPSGVVYELPAQMETEREELVFGITLKVVVIVESHPFEFGM